MIAVWGYAVLLKYAGWIVFGVIVWVTLKYALPQLISWLRWRAGNEWSALQQAKAYEAQLDRENREWLEAGIYEGQYPAVTMPLTDAHGYPVYGTSIHEQVEWYDYDDGLDEWK